MTQLGVQVVGSTIGLRASLDEAVAAADKWANATEAAGVRAARGLELIGVAGKQAEIAYAKLGIAASRYAEGTVGMEAAAARYQATVEGLYAKQVAAADAAAAAQERASIRYQNSLRTVGRAWATYITLPIAAVGYESIKLANEFQASMTRVQTYAGASGAEVRKMSRDILNSANVLPQGPVKAAEALYHLESIGIRGAHALDALKASGLAAGAGMADLTDSTTALGGALVADIHGAGNAKQAMAGLISIAGQGNMTMQQLADALGTGLLVKARDVGISLREVGAAMDVLVDRGIPARRAATYLGSTFALMEAPSAEATKALADMGIQATDMGKMLSQPNGLLHVLNMLQAGIQRVGQARGMADLMDAFGRSRQSTGIQTLVESLNAPVSSYSAKLAGYDKGVADSAKRMAEYQKTAQYQIHTALSQLEADFIKVGRGVGPEVAVAFKSIAMSVDDVTKAVEGLPGPVKEGLGALAAVLAVGGPILVGVAGAMKGMRALRNVLAELGIVSKATAETVDTSLATVATTAETAGAEADASLQGIGVAGADAATGVEQLDAALAGMAVAARDAALEADASLASIKASAEATTASLAEMDIAEGAGGAGMLGKLGTAGLFAGGGLLAGQIAGHAIGGQAGHAVSLGLEGAGIGAGIGMFFPEFGGPVAGALAGGAVGELVGAFHSLIGSAPSFEDSLNAAGRSLEAFRRDAALAGSAAAGFKRNIANDRVTVDQWKQSVQQAAATVRQTTPGTVAHARAVDQLRAAEANLKGAVSQLAADQQRLSHQEAQHAKSMEKAKKAAKDWATQLDLLSKNVRGVESATEAGMTGRAGLPFMMEQARIKTESADEKLQNYVNRLTKLAQSAQSSDPMLARVYRNLIKIAEAVNGIPSKKEVQIVIDETINRHFHVTGDGGMGPHHDAAWFKAIHQAEAKANAKDSGPKPLTQAQQVQIRFAQNKYDRATIEEQIRIDNAAIARLKRERQEGKINNLQYVNQVTAYYQDRQQMYDRLKTLDNKHKGDASKATSAFKQRVTQDQLLAKARLDLENGQYAAAQELLRKDKERLQVMLREAKNADERIAVERQLAEVERAMKQKSSSFALSLKLQEQMARADALAALDPSLQGPTALQLRLAEQAKEQAMKAIKSHKLTMEGLIAAWQIVAQANATIAQAAGVKANTYHHVSTDAVADSIKGLTHAQELQLRERLAQRDAHRGYAPNGPAADGYVVGDGQGGHPGHHHRHHHQGVQSGPAPRGGGDFVFEGAVFHITGVQNVRELAHEIEKLSRQKNHGRSGTRR